MTTFWVTRSQPGADRAGELLRSNGLEVLIAPVVEIRPTGEPRPDFDAAEAVAVFVSGHAVQHALDTTDWRPARALAVGAATARALADRGVEAAVAAAPSSEGIIKTLESGDVSAMVLVAGRGGRDEVLEWARQSDRVAVKWEVYERVQARPDLQVPKHERIDAIEAGSGDGARWVWDHPGNGTDFGAATALFVPSERVAGIARKIGFSNVFVCNGAGGSALVTALVAAGFAASDQSSGADG